MEPKSYKPDWHEVSREFCSMPFVERVAAVGSPRLADVAQEIKRLMLAPSTEFPQGPSAPYTAERLEAGMSAWIAAQAKPPS